MPRTCALPTLGILCLNTLDLQGPVWTSYRIWTASMSVSPRGGWEQGRVNGGQFLHLGLGGPHSGMPDNVLGRMALRGEKRGMGLPPAPMSPIVHL